MASAGPVETAMPMSADNNAATASQLMNNNPVLHTAPHQRTTNMTASWLTAASGNSCLDEQIERLKRCEYLREGEVKALCLRAREILVDESNVQRVDAPVTVRCVVVSVLRVACLFSYGSSSELCSRNDIIDICARCHSAHTIIFRS